MILEKLDLTNVPDLPQSPFLQKVAANLWEHNDVLALWVGGSLGRGAGDRYSDVDLRVAVDASKLQDWRRLDPTPLFEGEIVLNWFLSLTPETFIHHILLRSGELYDLYVQPVSRPPAAEKRLVLGCRHAEFGLLLAEEVEETAVLDHPVDPKDLQRFLESYWLTAHKGQKVIARGLSLIAWIGLNQMLRPTLLRLTYILATGRDCGDLRRATIHSLTPIVQHIQAYAKEDVLQIVGAPVQSVADIMAANGRLNEAVSKTGRVVAERFGFDYPVEIEAVVLRSWAEFQQRIEKDDAIR